MKALFPVSLIPFLALAFFASAAAIAAAVSADDQTIRIGTANAAYNDILSKVQPHFEAAEKIRMVYINDTSKPFEPHLSMDAVVNGKADIGILGTFLEDWIKAAKEKLPNLDTSKVTSRVIGKQASFIVTNRKVGVKKLSAEQFTAIFSGKTKNWRELGGNDLPVAPFLQTSLKGQYTTFQKKNMKGEPFAADLKMVDDFDQAKAFLSSTPGAISLYAEGRLNPAEMTIVETEEIFRPVTAIILGKPSEKVNKLLAFIAGEGRKYIKK